MHVNGAPLGFMKNFRSWISKCSSFVLMQKSNSHMLLVLRHFCCFFLTARIFFIYHKIKEEIKVFNVYEQKNASLVKWSMIFEFDTIVEEMCVMSERKSIRDIYMKIQIEKLRLVDWSVIFAISWNEPSYFLFRVYSICLFVCLTQIKRRKEKENQTISAEVEVTSEMTRKKRRGNNNSNRQRKSKHDREHSNIHAWEHSQPTSYALRSLLFWWFVWFAFERDNNNSSSRSSISNNQVSNFPLRKLQQKLTCNRKLQPNITSNKDRLRMKLKFTLSIARAQTQTQARGILPFAYLYVWSCMHMWLR